MKDILKVVSYYKDFYGIFGSVERFEEYVNKIN